MKPPVEVIDFTRPDGSRKNLFITNIPGTLQEDGIVYQLRQIFDKFGLVYGVQVFPCQWKLKLVNNTANADAAAESSFYAFVTFYSAGEATKAKESLNGSIMMGDEECKVSFAKRKKEVSEKHQLYVTKCYELVNYYLGFHSWSTSIKTIFEDTEVPPATGESRYVKYACMVQLTVQDLQTEGVGVWQEAYLAKEPLHKIQATAKCKKLCHMRAIENAFSKVLLIVFGNGKVAVEIDTTRPEFHADFVPDDQLVKVNDLDAQPESEEADLTFTEESSVRGGNHTAANIDDMNLHILQELEEEMC